MMRGSVNIVREYQQGAQSNTAASTAILMSLPGGAYGVCRLLLRAKGDDIVFNFGGVGVAASNTVTSNKLVDGNFTVANGEVDSIDINVTSQSYFSVINVAQASGATAYIRVCALNY